jgi:hypothetical protein
MKKHAKFVPDSRWVRYDKNAQLWIPNRKRIYLYWYKFLQLALVDGLTPARWGAYKGWGTPADILSQPFDAWWGEHWVDLFGYPEGGQPKFSLSTSRPKTDAIRYAYLVHIHRGRGDNWEIAQYIQKRETSKRGIPVPSFAYATEGVVYGAEDKLTVQSRVGRYKQMAQQIIDNVRDGTFPGKS